VSSYLRTSRNTELSALYYLESCFSQDWGNVNVIKTFQDAYSTSTNVPIVCARLTQTTTGRLEIGATTLDNVYLLIIDIFARSDGQRLDLADYIKDKLKDGWVHYQHSHPSGDNSTLERTVNGRDFIANFVNDASLEIAGSQEMKDRYRHNISVSVRNSI
jgi:hypothetical protein